jgi:hypothetical protein
MYGYHHYLNPFIVDNLAQSTHSWMGFQTQLLDSKFTHAKNVIITFKNKSIHCELLIPSKTQVCPRKTKGCKHNQMKQQ